MANIYAKFHEDWSNLLPIRTDTIFSAHTLKMRESLVLPTEAKNRKDGCKNTHTDTEQIKFISSINFQVQE